MLSAARYCSGGDSLLGTLIVAKLQPAVTIHGQYSVERNTVMRKSML